jgi:hypothetical protein
VAENDDLNFTEQVDQRLDEIFGDEPEPAAGLGATRSMKLMGSPLKDLKSAALALDWEITDEGMAKFGQEIDKLKKVYPHDQEVRVLLKLLASLAVYVKRKKSAALPESITRLQNAYDVLETIVLEEDLDQRERRRVTAEEVAEFKVLKKKIELTQTSELARAAASVSPAEPSTETPPPEAPPIDAEAADQTAADEPADIVEPAPAAAEAIEARQPAGDGAEAEVESSTDLPHELFARAVEELRHEIRVEFQKLREEIKEWLDEA